MSFSLLNVGIFIKAHFQIVVALKALGNIGQITEEFTPVLQNIIQSDTVVLEIRLQAVFVHRRTNCYKSKEYFLSVYQNFTGQPEIRIAAYLQSMKCPDYISINIIKKCLENEEVNQVGSFVWSHLTNLAKSASPVRVETQGLLVDGDLSNKYKMDIRKYSRNYEHSLFFDEYNFGGNADWNVIFGTDSYLPRTVSLNFTVDLFGESVNLFEMNTRMQGFEKYVESVFGPKGPLNTKNVLNKFANFTEMLQTIYYKREIPSYKDIVELLDLRNMKNEEFDDENIGRRTDARDNLQKRVDDLGYDLK